MPIEPRATYRLQLNPSFGFHEASGIAEYLASLGISHVYTSPCLQAAPGSTHGYDVVDHSQINEELGGEGGFARFSRTLGAAGLGHVLDIVPNHMSIASRRNAWWWDVLENGPASRYAAYFDVDWEPPEEYLHNMVLVPILGDHYGRVLEAGELRVSHDRGTFGVHYFDHVLPVAPRSLRFLLWEAAKRSGIEVLGFLADAFHALPKPTATDSVSVSRRHRDKEALYGLLRRLCREEPRAEEAIDDAVREMNGDHDFLHTFLESQNWRICFWRAAGRDLGYRRFFDINTLVGVRIEDARVFAKTHELVLEWLASGRLDGLRVDHPDGLRDPEEYFERLHVAAPHAWIVAEKIIEPGEPLRKSWKVAGTTGYEFLNRVTGLFTDPEGEAPLTRCYQEFIGEATDYEALVWEKKHLVLRDVLGSDVNRLTALLLTICEGHRRHRDYTRHELHHMLREVIACMPVYRTYVRTEPYQVTSEDVGYVTAAIARAREHRPDLDPELFEFFADLLLLRTGGRREREFAMRFQQLTGPAMAKGVEDTAFYCFHRLVALNDVGGDPGHFSTSAADFHQACLDTLADWPRTMLASSTHDTKRSEDVRARLVLLSEIPEAWHKAVERWSAHNQRHRHGDWPDRNTEYLFYQTLVGAWPIGFDRVWPYIEKAVREAKVHTAWTAVQPEYEDAVRAFVSAVLEDTDFLADMESFVAPLVLPGRLNSLAQTLLKLTAPGVPDIYQGTEIWDLSLVDPDNRRPVDYELRRNLLAALDGAAPEAILARMDEGLPKLWVIRQALALRRRHPEWFGPNGAYQVLNASGVAAGHVVAFTRAGSAASVVPRYPVRLSGAWRDTAIALPPGRWRNVLTGEEAEGAVALASLMARFPVAVLERLDTGS